VTASFLTKHLYVDWRLGASHFARHLVDGDVVSNTGNWQWAAGTGADTRPNRILNPMRQARRFDPDGDYVRRWVSELDAAEGERPRALAPRLLGQRDVPEADHRARSRRRTPPRGADRSAHRLTGIVG